MISLRHIALPVPDVREADEGRVVEQWGGPDVFDLARQLARLATET